MRFKTTNKQQYGPNYFKAKLLQQAKIRILAYRIGPTELKLDAYLKKQCEAGLKAVCLFLASRAQVDSTDPENVIIFFNNPLYEQMAKLITFGTGVVLGSHILTQAFAPLY